MKLKPYHLKVSLSGLISKMPWNGWEKINFTTIEAVFANFIWNTKQEMH